MPRLPLLTDEDGNPNDNAATYNLTVDNNVAVTVVTPTESWTTPMMRYNGLQLPPVIKAKRGMSITVNVTNNLPEETTIHWHGFKIPADQDGTTYKFRNLGVPDDLVLAEVLLDGAAVVALPF